MFVEVVYMQMLSYFNYNVTCMQLMSIIMLGFYGTSDLAAASVGIAYFSMIWYFIEGFLTAQDSLAYQAFACRQKS